MGAARDPTSLPDLVLNHPDKKRAGNRTISVFGFGGEQRGHRNVRWIGDGARVYA